MTLQSTEAALPERVPRFPSWPTSHPGPLTHLPGPGQRPVNRLRPEQVVELGYNQEQGIPSRNAETS